MAVSEPRQEKSSAVYQAFCEMWLSLLSPRQEIKGTSVFEQGSVHLVKVARRPQHTESKGEITQ